MSQTQNLFPRLPRALSGALSEEPVMLDGMKVLFDTKVGLYPVQLERKGKKNRERASADGGRNNGNGNGYNGNGHRSRDDYGGDAG
jgi:hypothetical protein